MKGLKKDMRAIMFISLFILILVIEKTLQMKGVNDPQLRVVK